MQFTYTGGRQARWSADGKIITFQRGNAIIQKQVDGSGTDRTVFEAPSDRAPAEPRLATVDDWSRDGRMYAVRQLAPVGGSGFGTLWLLAATPGSKPIPLSAPETRGYNGRFSPDGRWIAYNADDSGITEVYVQRVPSDGAKWKISQNGGARPRWRRDGREIFFVETGNVNGAGRLMAVPIELGAALRAGMPQPIVDVPFVPTTANGYPYALSPDGQRVLQIQPAEDPNRSAFTVVMNWTAQLRKN